MRKLFWLVLLTPCGDRNGMFELENISLCFGVFLEVRKCEK